MIAHTARSRCSGTRASGGIAATTASFAVQSVPGARMVVYTPTDAASGQALARLAAGGEADARFLCWKTHASERSG